MKKSFFSAAMIAAAAFIAANPAAYTAVNNNTIPENLKNLLQLSLRAPSSHNAQMWKIRYSEDMKIEIIFDESRLLKKVDPSDREAYMSIGALIENIISASGEFALTAEIIKSEKEDVIAEIIFRQLNKSSKNRMSSLINKRCSVRTKFKKTELKGKELNRILSCSNDCLYYFPLKSGEGKYISRQTLSASVLQTADDEKQKELSEWMRFSKEERDTSSDGITPEMMGFKGFMKNIIYLLFNENTAMKKSFRNKTESQTKKQLDNCAGFAVITSKDNTKESLIKTGRLLQRFWLECAGMDIALHPMNQAVQEKMITEDKLHQIGSGEKIQLVLRTGYIKKYPEPSSRRISIDDIIIYR